MSDFIKTMGSVAQGRKLSIYIPSKDKDGRGVDHEHWKKKTMTFLGRLFGRCTAMPNLQGIWAEDGKTLEETTVIVFSYVLEADLNRHAEDIRNHLIDMGRSMQQSEIGFGYEGTFYTLQLSAAKRPKI